MNHKSELFSDIGLDYATYRPTYPDELGQALASLCKNRQKALDVGCGTGQLTEILSRQFAEVVGTDINADQLKHAIQKPNISYCQEGAEQISQADESVDLIVVAQAAHWFDLPRFYKEVQRVTAPDGVIALVSYGVPYIESAANSVFQQGYWQLIHQYWPAKRKHVEEGYLNILFPFTELEFPDLFIHREMPFDAFIGYIKTWSAYKTAQKLNELEQFELFFEKLEQAWGNRETSKKITWPISVRAGKIK